jgi:hypothetical protein
LLKRSLRFIEIFTIGAERDEKGGPVTQPAAEREANRQPMDGQNHQRAKACQREGNKESCIALPGPKRRSTDKSANQSTADPHYHRTINSARLLDWRESLANRTDEKSHEKPPKNA